MVEEESSRAPKAPVREPVRWKVVVSPWTISLGILFAASLLILLQQYAVIPFTLNALLTFAVLGVILGILIPTLARGLAVMTVGKRHSGAQPPREGSS